MMTIHDNQDHQLYRRYTRSFELVLRVYKQSETLHFPSIHQVAEYLGCDDTRTAIKILRQISERYNLHVTFDDQGVRISNANFRGA